MEQFDPSLAERVWQRVQGHAVKGPDPTELTGLTIETLEDAAACLRLSKILGGHGGILLQLAREDRAQAGCLRGICAVLSGRTPEVSVPAPAQAPVQAVLRRCYVRHLHRVREYARRADDPDFGPAFEKLAADERTHCKLLLELLGRL